MRKKVDLVEKHRELGKNEAFAWANPLQGFQIRTKTFNLMQNSRGCQCREVSIGFKCSQRSVWLRNWVSAVQTKWHRFQGYNFHFKVECILQWSTCMLQKHWPSRPVQNLPGWVATSWKAIAGSDIFSRTSHLNIKLQWGIQKDVEATNQDDHLKSESLAGWW